MATFVEHFWQIFEMSNGNLCSPSVSAWLVMDVKLPRIVNAANRLLVVIIHTLIIFHTLTRYAGTYGTNLAEGDIFIESGSIFIITISQHVK